MIGEIIIHGIIFVLMMFLFFTSYSFPILNIGGNLGAGWWPRLILGFGMICTVLSVFFTIKKANSKKNDSKKNVLTKNEAVSLGISAFIIVAALLLIQIIGFIGIAPILIFGFIFQLGGRKPLSLVLVPIISMLFFALVFGRFMEVSLPRGMGIMRAISFYIY